MLAIFATGSLAVLRRELHDRMQQFLEGARDSFVTELGFEYAASGTLADAVNAAHRDIRFSDIQFIVFDSAGRAVQPPGGAISLGNHASVPVSGAPPLQRIEAFVRS